MRLRDMSPVICLVAIALIYSSSSVSSQDGKKLSAREIFYSPPTADLPAKKEAPKASAGAKGKKPVETAEAKSPSPSPKTAGTVPSAGKGAESTIPVSYTPDVAVPLGLRYSILKREGSGTVEVDPNTIFRSGDRIRLRVDVNTSGFLYVVNRGSSGTWKLLFPSPEIAEGDNRAQKGKQYEIPAGYVFTFDNQPGKENLFIVFSHRPVSDLEDLIYSLAKPPAQKAKEPARPLLAQANIQDDVISRLRTVYARDLIIEKVDENTAAPPAAPAKEKAIYVVNPSRDPDARVVADVGLIHQ